MCYRTATAAPGELERAEKRLATLAGVRPPYMDEYEALTGQLQVSRNTSQALLAWPLLIAGLRRSCLPWSMCKGRRILSSSRTPQSPRH